MLWNINPYFGMVKVLGAVRYNGMREHGELTAQILKGGLIRAGDNLTVLPEKVVNC